MHTRTEWRNVLLMRPSLSIFAMLHARVMQFFYHMFFTRIAIYQAVVVAQFSPEGKKLSRSRWKSVVEICLRLVLKRLLRVNPAIFPNVTELGHENTLCIIIIIIFEISISLYVCCTCFHVAQSKIYRPCLSFVGRVTYCPLDKLLFTLSHISPRIAHSR